MTEVPETLRRVPKEKKAEAPVTRVKSGGRLNKRLKSLADMFIRTHPNTVVRWVYDPQHKPDLSCVLSRTVDGYRPVFVKDLGDDIAVLLPGMKPDEPARIGDTVMMYIPEETHAVMRADQDQITADELTRVEQEFHESIAEISAEKGGREHHARPLGVSVTEEVEREVDGPDSHKAD